jgi:hypothetical protein
MFVPGKPFNPSLLQHCSLMGPFVSYKENEVLQIRSLAYLLLIIIIMEINTVVFFVMRLITVVRSCIVKGHIHNTLFSF